MSAVVSDALFSESKLNLPGDMRCKHVLHVIPGVAARYGGPSSVIFPLVAALNELDGVAAEIATTDADGAGGRLSRSHLPNDAAVHLFRRNWSEQWKVSFGLRSWLRRHARDYDLIHIHAVWSFATMAAARAAERHRVPYIIRPAGMFSDYSWKHRSWKKQLYWRSIERRTIQRAAGFHVTSEAEAREIRAVRADAHVVVVPNGVDEEAFSWPRDNGALRSRCGEQADGKPVVLFLSRMHPKKGIVDLLLPAVAAVGKRCYLAIAGGADAHAPEYEKDVQQAIVQMNMQQNVTMLGIASGNERWGLYDGADVFVLPSHAENFGIVVAEAMARGCPVVVTDGVQACEHVRSAGAGEVIRRDPIELAAAIDRVISDNQLRQKYSAAGRAYAERNFRWTNIATNVCEMYEHFLSTMPRRCNDRR